jgi:hypothetical protein
MGRHGWHVGGVHRRPHMSTREVAQAELDKLVEHYGAAHGLNLIVPPDVGSAIRDGRVEVRRRTVTVSGWE